MKRDGISMVDWDGEKILVLLNDDVFRMHVLNKNKIKDARGAFSF